MSVLGRVNTAVESIQPSTLRQLWSVVIDTQTGILLQLSDAELVNQLVNQLVSQLSPQSPLDRQEVHVLREYVRLKTPLIRDLAQARLFAH